MSSISSLPQEVIDQTIGEIHHLDDYLSLESTCRHLRTAVQTCSPGTLLALSYRSRATFFRPEPHFLLSALIPAIRKYACLSETRRVEVKRTIWHGCDGLLKWACHTPIIASYARWSTRSIHDLWEWRMRVLNPLSDLIDKCVGDQWYTAADVWSGGVEDAYTLFAEPETRLFQLQMYGDMFGAGMDSCLLPQNVDLASGRELGLSFRLDFVKYLLADWDVSHDVDGSDISSTYPPSPTDYFVSHGITTSVHPLRAVQDIFGPYVKASSDDSQKALLHLLQESTLWEIVVGMLRARCGPDFSDVPVSPEPHASTIGEATDSSTQAVPTNNLYPPSTQYALWKQQLWAACPYALGREFFEMLAHVWRVRGPEEVALLKLSARARGCDPDGEGEDGGDGGPFDPHWYTELQARVVAARAHPDLVETSAGWNTLRRWHAAIMAMEHEPTRVRVGACETHEGYPDFLGDMIVATSDELGEARR
jgi:hypothetical protein